MGLNIASNENAERQAQALELIAKHLMQTGSVVAWPDVQEIIRHGIGSSDFPVGSQLAVSYGEKTMLLDVLGHDIDLDPHGRFQHSTTFALHTLLDASQFDATEALYYAADGLAAGTYHFTLLAGYDVEYGGGATLQFTLTQAVPAGGVIMFPWAYQQQALATKISTYASREAAAAIETVSVSAGDGGTNLGTADGHTEHMNHTHRLRYGSNRYKESAIRQWLNSDKAGGAWWQPQSEFDRAPSYAARDGFLKKLDEGLVAAIGEVDKTVALNTVTDGGGSEVVRDRVWLLSRDEMGYGHENNITEGQTYPFFAGATNADRIYLLNGAPRWYWLRTPNTGYGSNARTVYTDGSLHIIIAHNSYGVLAAFTIY